MNRFPFALVREPGRIGGLRRAQEAFAAPPGEINEFLALIREFFVLGVRNATRMLGQVDPAFNIDDAPWEKLPGSTSFKQLGRFGGGSQVGVGIDILKPKQYSNRFHYHLAEEEHVFILKGSAKLHLGGKSYVMKERDYCCFPAGQRAGHHLFNHTKENCLFITIGDNNPHDVAYYPKEGRVQIRMTKENFRAPKK